MTYAAILGDCKCECSDDRCPHHKGKSDCRDVAKNLLYRIDMQDETGTAFCDDCADDAFSSGLFTTADDEAELSNELEPDNTDAALKRESFD